MYKNLENYLEEISHYLGRTKEGKDILAEIRSHVLEKARGDGLPLSEESLAEAIAGFGPPHAVAEKYLEGSHIIIPSYRRFLFAYTWLLFSIHYGLKIISLLLGTSFSLMPFDLTIRITRLSELLRELPLTWIFDFGLVAIFLYIISQNPLQPRLAWPAFLKRGLKPVTVRSSEKWKFWSMTILLALLLATYSHWGTIFFSRIDLKTQPRLLLQPTFSQWLSLAVLALLLMEIISLLLRARFRSLWIDLASDIVYMACFSLALNLPKEKLFIESAHMVVADLAAWVIVMLMVFLAFDILRRLRTIFMEGRDKAKPEYAVSPRNAAGNRKSIFGG
ncbi:MAG: hypothetical protein JXI33_00185 [Candidatus Aminicenantes bacterium]|nr:hypothetical protein [Candidatus Aminicenantes bacterium]